MSVPAANTDIGTTMTVLRDTAGTLTTPYTKNILSVSAEILDLKDVRLRIPFYFVD